MASKRNLPCPCGSGMKYKKCCIRKVEQMDKELTNDYRKEVEDPIAAELAKVGEAEMMKRDMFAAMRNLQFRKAVVACGQEHYAAIISVYEAFRDELLAMPLSEGLLDSLDNTTQEIEQLIKVAEQSTFSRKSAIFLEALEMAVAGIADQEEKG